ncbi:MAG: hypothetical protein AB7F19_03515 [Candidatus Babeliales bacterium]
MQSSADIRVQEIKEISSNELVQFKAIFIRYFSHLYKEISPATLGVTEPVDAYLARIFAKTRAALGDNKLKLAFAFLGYELVGCTTYELLRDTNTVLIRTLPINILYKEQELMIRNAYVQHVLRQYPEAQKVLVMVRRANTVHRALCEQGGFRLYNEIFEQSKYINSEYSQQYLAYAHEKSRVCCQIA